jgi:integrase
MDHNPARDVKAVPYKTEGHHTWTIEEIHQFEDHHPIGTKARLAMALLRYLLQRRQDTIVMGEQHRYKGHKVRFNQSKTGQLCIIPILPELQNIIDQTETGDLVWLVNNRGKPYKPVQFSKTFRTWCDQAGLPHCTAHGLRKGGAALLAEAGKTNHEIMAITGHRTLSELERYTREFRREAMADQAISSLSG